MPRAEAPLVEIFRSIQGEGPHVGRPMVFVRLAVCPLRCLYCDSEHTFQPLPAFRVHGGDAPGREEGNPCAAERCAGLVEELASRVPLPVTFTGGEPLVWPGFVAEAAAALRKRGFRIHLETAALDPRALEEVAGAVDHLSADYKLPSTLEAGDPRPENRACIAQAVDRGIETAVKVVLTRDVPDQEWWRTLEDLAPFRGAVELVLQPVTPARRVAEAPDLSVVLRRVEEARRGGFRVRMLPQVHRILGLP